MKALIKSKAEPGFDYLDIEKPVVGENDILLKILAASICGSDVHIYEWTSGYEFMPLPLIPGHEFTAEVVEIGKNIVGLALGDRVTSLGYMPCGECRYCRMGNVKQCEERLILGLTKNGSFAEYMVVKGGADLIKIPDGISNEIASLVEPLAVCLNGIDLSGIKPGQKAAVLGPGPIGLLTVQLLKAAGAGEIVITGTSADEQRLDIARQLGADVVIKIDEADPVKTVRDTAGLLDYVFEATGIPQTISQGLQMLKIGGKVMVMGIHAKEASFDPIDLVRKRKSLIGVYAYERSTWLRALSLLSTGKIDVSPLITHILPFHQYAEGFELACNKSAAKVILVPED